jgi:hypothetical protein
MAKVQIKDILLEVEEVEKLFKKKNDEDFGENR